MVPASFDRKWSIFKNFFQNFSYTATHVYEKGNAPTHTYTHTHEQTHTYAHARAHTHTARDSDPDYR